jgi:hypothetical protein
MCEMSQETSFQARGVFCLQFHQPNKRAENKGSSHLGSNIIAGRMLQLCPQISAPAISPGQKWWPMEISWSQWEGSSCTHDGPCFFPFGVGRVGRVGGGVSFFNSFLVLNVFLTCSHHVPLRFPKLFPMAFPIVPRFYPIWFAQSSTLKDTNWKCSLLGNTFICRVKPQGDAFTKPGA